LLKGKEEEGLFAITTAIKKSYINNHISKQLPLITVSNRKPNWQKHGEVEVIKVIMFEELAHPR